MMKACLAILTFFLFTTGMYGQALPAPFNLRCDFLLNTNQVSQRGMPVRKQLKSVANKQGGYQFPVIRSKQPLFNWQVDTSITQIAAVRILIASSPGLLNKNQADYWDSKKVLSTNTRLIYEGRPLENRKIYYWKVCVWDESGQPSAFSATEPFYYDSSDSSQAISYYPLTAEIQTPGLIKQLTDSTHFFDFGKDAFAQLQFKISSRNNDSVWIEAGEALDSTGKILKASGNIRHIKMSLYTKKGTHTYAIQWPVNEKRNRRNNPILMPGYIGEVFPFRYVSVEHAPGIKKIAVERKTVFYPFDDSASFFYCSDTVLNQIWNLCKYAEKATSFTGYYVDGDRERVPYEADALINQLSHYAVDPEFSMARRSMAYVIYNPTWPTEWSLQNMQLAWNDYMYTGDNSFLKKYYTELQKKLLLPLAGDNGLISTKTGKQTSAFLKSIHFPDSFDDKQMLRDIVDWPQSSKYVGKEKEYDGETDGFVFTTYNAVVNAFYYRALVLMKNIAGVLNKQEDENLYSTKAQEVYTSFQNTFVTPGGLIKDGDSTQHSSLHANMFALAFGLVPDSNVEKVIAFIKSRRMACSVYGAQFLLDALYDNNADEYALSLLNSTAQRSWYNMIRPGSTITMEAWDKLYKPNLDWNHAWGAAPANIIVRKLMGVEPLTPGFETFIIKPQLGDLSFATLKTPTIKGPVELFYKKDNDKDSIELVIPGGSKATVYLTFNPNKPALFVDGKQQYITPENGSYIISNMGSGRHIIKME